MANTFRSVDSRFWSDTFVRKLTYPEIYAFLYFLTSPHSTWCGVYELPLDVAAFEMKVDEKELRSLMAKLYPKIIYIEDWVYIPNWIKYHTRENGTMSPQQKKGLENSFLKVPERIRLKIREFTQKEIPYVYPMVTDSPFTSTFTSTSTFITSASQTQKINTNSSQEMKYQENHHSTDNEPIVDYHTRDIFHPKKELAGRLVDFEDEIKTMRSSKDPAEKIVAHYWALKGYKPKTAFNWKKQLGRDIVYARELQGYNLEDIFHAFKEAQIDGEKNHYDWKISTVVKKILSVANHD